MKCSVSASTYLDENVTKKGIWAHIFGMTSLKMTSLRVTSEEFNGMIIHN